MRNPSDQSNWQRVAACRDAPPSIFFPEDVVTGKRRNPHLKQDIKQAKEICGRCPVKGPCLEYAILHDSLGIWGGLTFTEREELVSRETRWELRNVKEECGSYQPLYGHS